VSDIPTLRKFVEEWPLYASVTYKGSAPLPSHISLHCGSCGKETTWVGDDIDCQDSQIYVRRHRCSLCQRNNITFIILKRSVTKDSDVETTVQKIGQFPAQTIAVPSGLAKHLGQTTHLYKKALISRNQGFGIAAVAYLRRIVEDKTDELIDIVAEQANERGLGGEEIEAIRAAKKEQTYSEKLKVASTVIPASLRPGGTNPLGTLFGLLSDGLHDRSEEECLVIADEIREVFEYVFENLRTQIEDEKRFKERINKLSSRTKL
jgi:hypothetical protein